MVIEDPEPKDEADLWRGESVEELNDVVIGQARVEQGPEDRGHRTRTPKGTSGAIP